jgi:hypothetical protein
MPIIFTAQQVVKNFLSDDLQCRFSKARVPGKQERFGLAAKPFVFETVPIENIIV